MKTKLYRMWIEFCNKPEYQKRMYTELHSTGDITFNGLSWYVSISRNSHLYKVWNALQNMTNERAIFNFIVEKFHVFVKHLPEVQVFLDLQNISIRDLAIMYNSLYDTNKPYGKLFEQFGLILRNAIMNRKTTYENQAL